MSDVEFNTTRRRELESLPIDKLRQLVIEKIPDVHNTTDLIIKERMIKAILIAEQKSSMSGNDNLELVSFVIGIKDDRDVIKKNITERLNHRLQNGMIEEVEALVQSGISYEKLDFFGLEYKFIGQHIKGELNYNDMFQKLNSSIHKFAKRQMTWFRKMEKEGININWVKRGQEEYIYPLIEEYLKADH